MDLLRAIHQYGPMRVRDARREHGDREVDIALRTKRVKRYRLMGGDVLVLGRVARRELGLPPAARHPSPASLQQQLTRGQALRALASRGHELVEHRNRYVSVTLDPHGRRTTVVVNHAGYDPRSFRRLVTDTLRRDILSGHKLLILDPGAQRLRNVATDHQEFFTLKSLHDFLAPDPNPESPSR